MRFLEGRFADTLATATINRLAILMLDGDLDESTTDALTALYLKHSVRLFLKLRRFLTYFAYS